ncbi:hypothetical protein DICPUDRAFT_148381 [Dictyostelium purpureum]|uniref:EF-hand domain-containing protein n=1 Tax=Dictyostelium purpureum TaxID=5786 RepID=F0ZAZ3_DICPU|nr:uncharacterized protein DICPUDRAFT_148381 [Dictyostelium purpureum]EGC38913.1 hypothetical protein DICPUDRAFT_148381 [Dictyostelium purpureum]|eukprot:XP_003284593.1 hypothetical protein DICPUDRAFT_148381 [Dictyostelium purpureum]
MIEDFFKKNKDQQITYDQCFSYFKSLENCKDPETLSDCLFSSLDKDRNETISKKDFDIQKFFDDLNLCSEIINRNYDNLLNEFDGNKDGKITWEETFNVFKKDPSIGYFSCENMTRVFFQILDTNNDKVITIDDLRKAKERDEDLYLIE